MLTSSCKICYQFYAKCDLLQNRGHVRAVNSFKAKQNRSR